MVQGDIDMHAQHADHWAAKQTYLALGFGLAAAAELQIEVHRSRDLMLKKLPRFSLFQKHKK